MGNNQNLYNQLLKYGLSYLENKEVIELLLKFKIEDKSQDKLAGKLLKKYGSVSKIIDSPLEQLIQLDNVNKEQCLGLKLPHKIANFYLLDRLYQKPHLKAPDDVVAYLYHSLKGLTIEVFKVLYLDMSNGLLTEEDHSRGTLSYAAIYPRELFKRALNYDAASLILAHNHPSGNLTPSKEDVFITNKLSEAASTLEMVLHDHLIISEKGYYSFKEQGILSSKQISYNNQIK